LLEEELSSSFWKPVEAGIVKEELTKVFESAKIFGNDNQLKITTKYKVEAYVEADQEVNKLFESLKQHFSRFNVW
jgi:SecD/SecF fusion protein